MAVTTELTALHRTADGLRTDLDASELDDLTPLPAASTAEASDIPMLDETPFDPALREGADDERVGGYPR